MCVCVCARLHSCVCQCSRSEEVQAVLCASYIARVTSVRVCCSDVFCVYSSARLCVTPFVCVWACPAHLTCVCARVVCMFADVWAASAATRVGPRTRIQSRYGFMHGRLASDNSCTSQRWLPSGCRAWSQLPQVMSTTQHAACWGGRAMHGDSEHDNLCVLCSLSMQIE